MSQQVDSRSQREAVAYSHDDAVRLAQRLEADYTLEGLRSLCFTLDVDFDNLAGETKEVKARTLVQYLARRNQLEPLVAILEAPATCPYPGMVPFTADNAPFFFGRSRDVQWLLDHLELQSPLWIIGPSASGKSSLITAGLLPALAAQPSGLGAPWSVRMIRPGQNPLAEFAKAVNGEPATLALAGTHSPSRTLLIVDQLEELFAQVDQPTQIEFVAHLKKLLESRAFAVLCAMRADFYPQLMSSDLWPIPASTRLEVAPLRGEALRLAIQKPATSVGVYVEPALLERLMADAAGEPGVLPLLQETMRSLWRRMNDRRMSLEVYAEMGRDRQSGLAVAVATRADAAIDSLTGPQQSIARRVLMDLVQLGEGRPDIRRQQKKLGLARPADNPNDFETVLNALVDNRLIVLTGADDDPQAEVDLAHEILINGWPRLREWLSQDRVGLQVHREMTAATADWALHNQDPSYVYIGARLLDAQRFSIAHPEEILAEEQQFLVASERQDRLRLRSRYMGQAAGAAVGAACGYAVGYVLAVVASPSDLPAGTMQEALTLLPLLIFGPGMLTGGMIGLGLWLQHHWRTGRMLLAGAAGGLAGGLPMAVIMWSLQPAGIRIGAAILAGAVGALLAAGVGVGAGYSENRRVRFLATLLGGFLGAALAVGLSLVPGMPHGLLSPVGTVLLGVAVGLMTGLGLYVTAVHRNVHTTT